MRCMPGQRLIDRERERTLLLEARDNPPSLVVLTGRRRVGKSFLLSSVLNGPRVVGFHADEHREEDQLDLLAQEAARLLPGSPHLFLPDWNDALEFFERQAKAGGALVVVLDEFQYLCAAQPALPSMIQRAWDRW